MRLALLCGLLVAAGLTPAQGGLLNLNKMVRQVTKKIPLFNYWPYGCYCGLGGRGQPKDATDWCCQKHDCCYKHLRTYQCRPKRDHYNYTFSQGDVQCRLTGTSWLPWPWLGLPMRGEWDSSPSPARQAHLEDTDHVRLICVSSASHGLGAQLLLGIR
ncbi:group IID secretory phospholipase A2 isoform X2 [Marmota flaviventris]|uniref:group IID secretory phospholipase A2 isoform X2 n=1 Tax=Marmota flaviventris TaxID=93162 RepID=UPI000FFF8EB5|nr:group IID secretory phospholipase A2 isoform X2 [Marmota flaviventris]